MYSLQRILKISLVLCALILCSFSFLTLEASQDDGHRALKVITDLSHRSGKLGSYRALIIGINDYQDSRIPDLETAVSDAKALADLLGEKYGFKIKLLLDRKAGKEAIFKALRDLAKSTMPNDSVLIYYAGHGELDRLYNDGWWIPADAEAGNLLTYLDNVEVQKSMRSMKARHVLLIADSCYSGTLFGRARAMPSVITDKYYLDLYNEKSRWGMTSGNKEPVSDRGTGGHSVFAYQLLKALKQTERQYTSTQEIYTRIAPIVSNNSEQTPLCRPIRNTGDQGGEFVFVASGAAIVSEPSTQPDRTTLEVNANISGAAVLVDGREVGKTPLTGVHVSPGEHRISVEKEGYEPYSKRIRLEAGRSMSMHVHLIRETPAKGRLFVDTEPDDARVRILNIGPRFYQGMELEPGRYHVEVSADGYEKKSLWVTLNAGEDKTFDISPNALAAGRDEKFTNSLGMGFVLIPAGSFMMGSPSSEPKRDSDERQHKVTLTKGFYMGVTEITQGQWKAIMGNNPSNFKGDNRPVERVSWDDCQEFIRKLNRQEGTDKYRLPTEAEWEYACRAGTTTPFYTGNCISTDQANYDGNYPMPRCSKGNYRKKTIEAASFSPNAWGLYDMHGNVWEWCQDWFGDYPSSHVTDPKGPSSGSGRVHRGGSWYNDARHCRSANRSPLLARLQGRGYLGFRLARTP